MLMGYVGSVPGRERSAASHDEETLRQAPALSLLMDLATGD